MTPIAQALLELLTWYWVLHSASGLIKTRKARRLFNAHQRWIDGGVEVKKTKRVALVIAVKGVSGNFDRFMDFVLSQDYPEYHVIFTTESEADPVHAAIRNRLAESSFTRARLIVAGMAEHTGQKVHNQLAAFKELDSSDQIIAFADGDLYGFKNWLSCLALPLNLGQADFTTGYRWMIPANQSLPNRIIALMGTAIEPLIGPAWRICLWGGSMAMTREVFEELKVPENLVGSINDDVRLSAIARESGKRMKYVRSVAAPSPVDFSWASFFEFGRRQYFQLRVGHKSLWWMALMVPLFYLASFLACSARLVQGNLLMLVPFGVAIALNVARTRVRRGYLEDRFHHGEADTLDEAVRGSWWLDPVINFLHLVIILSSACGREIVWAGIRYRVTGPQKTEILNSKN
ncbi:MAG: glycosyltransferase family 2 protein [Luteolibacter sp.]|uniref:glycosyltransferase family 2 protein n=1 Tax=Luteolibacter sp. TaxID=1962973 RepID=UPI003267E85D